jgi:hypothetical protein
MGQIRLADDKCHIIVFEVNWPNSLTDGHDQFHTIA